MQINVISLALFYICLCKHFFLFSRGFCISFQANDAVLVDVDNESEEYCVNNNVCDDYLYE